MKTLTKRIVATIAVFAATIAAAYATKAIQADAYYGFTNPQYALEYYTLTEVCGFSADEAADIMTARFGKIERLYPKTFIVSTCDPDTNRVFLVDANDNEWVIFGVEDWMEGDIASAIMSDNGTTKTIYDDKIVELRYSGYMW